MTTRSIYAEQDEVEERGHSGQVARSAALPSIPKELIDLFVTGPMSGDAVNAASLAFKKALIERAMGADVPAPGSRPKAVACDRRSRD